MFSGILFSDTFIGPWKPVKYIEKHIIILPLRNSEESKLHCGIVLQHVILLQENVQWHVCQHSDYSLLTFCVTSEFELEHLLFK